MKSRTPNSDQLLIRKLNQIVKETRREKDLPPLRSDLKDFLREGSPREARSGLAEAFESDHPPTPVDTKNS